MNQRTDGQANGQSASRGLVLQDVGGVDVGFWNPVRAGQAVGNFGDVMSPNLVSRMHGGKPRSPRTDGRVLLAQGSIIHLASAGAVLWGTGINGKIADVMRGIPRDLDVRAVRGPWTRRVLQHLGIDAPPVYGDPAALVGRLYPELHRVRGTAGIDGLCVPNFHDFDWMSRDAGALELTCLDSRTDVSTALASIASAEFVVGSSLHAIVVAEALGIPARFVHSSEESSFKYLDYLAGTNRPHETICSSVAEAVALGGMPPPETDLDALFRAFPRDLWEGGNAVVSRPQPIGDATSGTQEWLKMWVQAGAATTQPSDVYMAHLAALRAAWKNGNSTDVEGLRVRASEYRRWIVPSLPTGALDNAQDQSLDVAMLTGDPDVVRRVLQAQTRGFLVRVYDSYRTPAGNLMAMTLDTPVPSEPLSSLTLPSRAGRPLDVDLGGLVVSPLQTRIDLDVVADESFELDIGPESRAQVTLRSGVTWRVPVQSLDQVPSYATGSSGSEPSEVATCQ